MNLWFGSHSLKAPNDKFTDPGFADNSSSFSSDISDPSQRQPITPVTYVVASPSQRGDGTSVQSRIEPWMPRGF